MNAKESNTKSFSSKVGNRGRLLGDKQSTAKSSRFDGLPAVLKRKADILAAKNYAKKILKGEVYA